MPGQINRGTALGELIYSLSSRPDINAIVEIGAWNGLGSTKCVIDGIKNKLSPRFISIESSPAMYAEAVNNVGVCSNVYLLLGRIIDPSNIPPMNLSDIQKVWLKEDLDNYSKVPNVLDRIPENIDLLILDGGEFTSEMEFEILAKRSRYVIMDDTNGATGTIKFSKIRDDILRGFTDFSVIQDCVNDRNGWLFVENNTLGK